MERIEAGVAIMVDTKKTSYIFAEITELSAEMLAIEANAHVAPWSEKVFGLCFGAGYRVLGLYAYENPEAPARLLGYTVSHRVLDELTLMNIAVEPAFQGRGYGQALLQELLGYASSQPAGDSREWRIFLEVRESNEAALKLYQRCGFVQVGRRAGYYPPATPGAAHEAALVMVLEPTLVP